MGSEKEPVLVTLLSCSSYITEENVWRERYFIIFS